MKKFILLAAIGISAAVYQPVKAQVSINVNIGTPAYYAPRSYNAYYVPARTVVYPNYYRRNVVVYRPQPRYVQHTNYYRPVVRHYSVRQVSYKHYNKSFKQNRGHRRGRH